MRGYSGLARLVRAKGLPDQTTSGHTTKGRRIVRQNSYEARPAKENQPALTTDPDVRAHPIDGFGHSLVRYS